MNLESMGNLNNDMIYKKICLEHFKSRVPGLISSINQNENVVNKGNWNEIPYDLKLDEIQGLDALKNYLVKKHYGAIKVKCTTVDDKRTTETVVPEWYANLPSDKGVKKLNLEEPRLRYRDLMLWYYWIINLCKKSDIYEYSINNANVSNTNGYWVLMDNFDVFDADLTRKVKLVFNFNEEETIVNGEVKTNEWEKSSYYMIVSRDEKEFFDNHSGFQLVNFTQTLIGRLTVPKSIIGSKVPDFVYYSEIQDILDTMDKIKNSEDCCTKSDYEAMGGDEMFLFLDTNSSIFDSEVEDLKKHNLIPYVDIPLTLSCDIEDLGIMFNDEQEWIAGNKYNIGDIVTYNDASYIATKENNGVYNTKYDEVYFDTLNGNNEIVLTNWLEYIETNPETIKWLLNPGGEIKPFVIWENYIDNMNLVENIMIEGEAVSQLKSFRTTRKCYTDNGFLLDGVLPYKEGTTELIKNKNGYVELLPPFLDGVPFSVSTDDNGDKYGDVLYEITEEEGNVIRFRYVIGGKLNKDGDIVKPIYNDKGEITNAKYLTGIHYNEAYLYSWQEVRDEIDGNPVKMRYRLINFSLNVDNGSTFPILSKVRYKAQDVWNNDAAITVPTFRKDYLIGMMEYPTEDVDIVIDRGLSHAFEKHLMLTETNTFNDLKNYKNNYFNLQ